MRVKEFFQTSTSSATQHDRTARAGNGRPWLPNFSSAFNKGGLRTGVCIRPSKHRAGMGRQIEVAAQHMGFDVVEEMNQKIIYAKKRLGCMLFLRRYQRALF